MINVRSRLRGWTYTAILLLEGRSLALAAQGLDLWRTSEWGLAGERCGTGWTHGMLRSTSALLRPGTQPIGLKSFNYYPFPRPFTPQCGKTCRPTLPIRTSADGRHTHIYNTRLDSCSCREHVHARVCSALTYSFHQCPGVMPGFIRGMAKLVQLAA